MKAGKMYGFIVTLALFMGITLGMMSCSNYEGSEFAKNPKMISAKGTIAGRIIDRCTDAPVKGVKVSIAENGATVTTDNFGEFVFKNVPVNAMDTPGGALFNDSYVIIMDFTAKNQGLADTSALRYNNHEYVTVDVIFTDLNDGDNDGTGGDAGSGLDTPVHQLVANVELVVGKLNTQINGQVVDPNYNPVANAIVYLKKNLNHTGNLALIKQTTSDVNGNYVFYNVEAGVDVTIEAMNSTRTMSGSRPLTLTCNMNSVLRTQVTAERLILGYDDNVSPFVTMITPENTQDVNPTGLTIVYSFSEPIKQTPYTRTDLGKGHNTIVDDITVTYVGMKKAAAPIPFNVAWNSTFTQLTITPAGLVGAARYTVNNFISVGSAKITDNANRAVVNNAGIIGDFETLNFTTTGSTTLPAAPTLKRDTLVYPTNLVNWNGGTVRLTWTVDDISIIRHFELYKQIGNGSFELINAHVRKMDTIVTIGANELVYGDATNPLMAQKVKYQIRSVSTNLVPSGFSSQIEVVDRVSPTIVAAVVDNPAGSTTFDYVYIRFSEPINTASAELPGSIFISDNNSIPPNIRDAIYLGYNTSLPGGNGYKVRITVDNNAINAGETLSATGVRDLNGLGVSNSLNF